MVPVSEETHPPLATVQLSLLSAHVSPITRAVLLLGHFTLFSMSVTLAHVPMCLGGPWSLPSVVVSQTAANSSLPSRPKELPCSALAPSLEPCFSRPERPANRRLPSRWAPPIPTASGSRSPGPPASLEEHGEEDTPEEKPHL